jgi:dihydroxyacetone kinase, phosphotransfer subunit
VRGIVIISHANNIAIGVKALIEEVAKDVPITTAGGLEGGLIGTSFEDIQQAIEANTADEVFAFYDLGSAKLNLEMVIELSQKKITVFDVALVEGAYIAAALLQTGVDNDVIFDNLAPLQIK